MWLGCLVLLPALMAGCAIHYYDRETGTEHLWGFGHLKMRAVPLEGNQPPYTNATVAFVTGTRTLGLNIGAGEDFAGMMAGWDARSRVVITSEDAQFCLLWPTNTFWLPRDLKDHLFTIRISTNSPPFITHTTTKDP